MFDGKTADAQYWMGSVYAYVALNNHIYDTDTKKVTFTLSFCKEGAVKSWAQSTARHVLPDYITPAVSARDRKNYQGEPQGKAILIVSIL